MTPAPARAPHATPVGVRRARSVAGAERRPVAAARRLVVKLGTNVVLHEDGTPAAERLAGIVTALAALRRAGREVVLVTSGAVGLGASRLRATGYDDPTDHARACAALGQGRLMAWYQAAFAAAGVDAAQLLLTDADFRDAHRAARLGGTLDALLACGAIPVVNENDAVTAGAEADVGAAVPLFRDNDMLAALVAELAGAALLVLLSDVDGVCAADPALVPDAPVLPVIGCLTPALLDGAAGRAGRGRGGMAAKLRAAGRATAAGVAVVIANGRTPGVLARVAAGEALGTLLMPEVAS